MSESPSRPRIRGNLCIGCRLWGGRDHPMATRRALFYHLLWHKDSKDAVCESLLNILEIELNGDRLDPGFRGPRASGFTT